MQSIIMRFLLLALLIAPVVFAEDADEVREKGIAALKESQTNPRAIVDAARFFVKAGALYNEAGNEEKNVEMNSFLYWCKKKMTMADIDAFTKGGEAAVTTKLAALDKVVPKVDEAEKWFERAEEFAKKNPNEHLLIAIRFYEVADRFKGSDGGMKALDRSLKEQLEDKTSVVKGAQPALVRPAETAAVEAGKRAMPGADEIKKSEKTIKDLFKEDYAKTDAASRQVLIAKLLQQADENKGDPAVEFVLIREARDLAILGGDANCAAQAQGKLRDAFKVDFASLLLEMKKLESSAKGAEPATALATVCANASDDALAAADYDHAVRFNSKAEDLLPQIKDAAFKARMKTAIPRAQAIRRESVAAVAAQKTLNTKPDDPAANLTAGKFALMLGKLEKALQLLAKGNDSVLGGLAKRELAPPTEATEQLKLADGWFERAEKEPLAMLKIPMQERAAVWYSTTMPALTGLSKLKAEERLKRLPQVSVPEPAVAKIEIKPELIKSGKDLDLFKLIDTKYDSILGKWTMTPQGLRSEGPSWVKLQIPFCPPADYDLKYQFTRLGEKGEIAANIKVGGKQVLVTFGRFEKFAGMANIDGRGCEMVSNPTHVELALETNRKYSVVIQVRGTIVRVALDGQQLYEIDTNTVSLSLWETWRISDLRVIGLMTNELPFLVHNLLVEEINGSGMIVQDRRSQFLGGLGASFYEELPKECTLVGFKVTTNGGEGDSVGSVQPVYLNDSGKTVLGLTYGQKQNQAYDLIAKPGYAVGGLVGRGLRGVEGFKVVFMRMGNALMPNDSYESEWVGRKGEGLNEIKVSGRAIGVFGRRGQWLDQLGLIYKP